MLRIAENRISGRDISYLKSQLFDLKSERSYLLKKKTKWPIKDVVPLMTKRINTLYKILGGNVNVKEDWHLNPINENSEQFNRMFRKFD